METNFKIQYKGKMLYSRGTNHSRGVMILIKYDLEFDLKSSVLDTEGRHILINATVQGSDYLFANIYAPNKVQEQCEFFSCLDKLVEKFHVSAEQRLYWAAIIMRFWIRNGMVQVATLQRKIL